MKAEKTSLMNPYYVVFFSTAIDDRLKKIGMIYKKAGYIRENIERFKGRDLGIAVAKGMIRQRILVFRLS